MFKVKWIKLWYIVFNRMLIDDMKTFCVCGPLK